MSIIDPSKLYVCGNPTDPEDGEFAMYVSIIYRDDRCVRVQRYQRFGSLNIGVKTYSLNAFSETYRVATDREAALYFAIRKG